jgi:hypothetical protein
MTGQKMKRNLEVDTVRGIACVLLVLFHVVGDTPAVGLRIPEGHWLQVFNEALAYIRMPLFSFISGYVYAFRPYQGNAGGFIKGKVRRLLLPLLTVGTLFAVVQAVTPGANMAVEHWWLLHIVPVGHFWFLEALFIVFLVVILLEHLKALSTPAGFAAVWALSAVLFDYFSPPNYFGAQGAVYLLPFFLAGLACKRFDINGRRRAARLRRFYLRRHGGHAVPAVLRTGQLHRRTRAGRLQRLSSSAQRMEFAPSRLRRLILLRDLPAARVLHRGQPHPAQEAGRDGHLRAAGIRARRGPHRPHRLGPADQPACGPQSVAAGGDCLEAATAAAPA